MRPHCDTDEWVDITREEWQVLKQFWPAEHHRIEQVHFGKTPCSQHEIHSPRAGVTAGKLMRMAHYLLNAESDGEYSAQGRSGPCHHGLRMLLEMPDSEFEAQQVLFEMATR